MAKVSPTSYPFDGINNNIGMLEMFQRSGTSPADKQILLATYIPTQVKPNLDQHSIKLKSKTLEGIIAELKEFVKDNTETNVTLCNFYGESES
jgi:hypothetical protein